ncbi:MAG TPA: hypothetical protein VF202_01135 [Trueperaceae bacterium]
MSVWTPAPEAKTSYPADYVELLRTRIEGQRRELAELHRLYQEQLKDNEELYNQISQLPPVAASINSPNGPGGILPVNELVMARAEIHLLKQALQRAEDRLARYEGRPSPVVCPRACCIDAPRLPRGGRLQGLRGGAA